MKHYYSNPQQRWSLSISCVRTWESSETVECVNTETITTQADSSLLPAWVNMEVHLAGTNISHEFRSQQYFPYSSPAQFIRVCFDLWPLTWLQHCECPIAKTVRLLPWGSEFVRNGGRIFGQTRTRRKTFAHGNSDTVCDVYSWRNGCLWLYIKRSTRSHVYHSKRKKLFFKICPGKHHTHRVGHHDLWPEDFLCKSVSGQAKILN